MDIKVDFPGGKRVDASVNGFTFRTDQPINSGGAGSASSPFDLFLASIATCMGYYILTFCQIRNLPTDGLGLNLTTEKDPETNMITRIGAKIQLPEGFPAKYQEAVKKAAAGCAIKKHLDAPPVFHIEAAPIREMSLAA